MFYTVHMCIYVCSTTVRFIFPFLKLLTQLNYVHNQILSVVTQYKLRETFAKKPNFDLRVLLEGKKVCLLLL